MLGSIAIAVELAAVVSCGPSARGPPITVHIALERAHRALCEDRTGIESPRALVEAVVPVAPCLMSDAAARVRCYLAQPQTTVAVARVPGGLRVRVAIPQLSDHVHDVVVRRRGRSLTVEIESRN